jgi:hypothetical protein
MLLSGLLPGGVPGTKSKSGAKMGVMAKFWSSGTFGGTTDERSNG